MSPDNLNRADQLTVESLKSAASVEGTPQLPTTSTHTQPTASPGPFDLSQVTLPSNVGPSQIEVRRGFTGKPSSRAAEAVIEVAAKSGLPNPLPAALEIHPVPGDSRALHGVPKAERNDAWLNLNWNSKGRSFNCTFRRLFTLLGINVPKGTRMLINVAVDQHVQYGPCLKLWWDKEAFVPVNTQEQDRTN